jgi:hypothetical protein
VAPYLARNNIGGLTVMTRSVLIWTKDHMWQYPIDSVAFGVGKKCAVADLKNGYGVMLDVRPAMRSKDYLARFNGAAEAALRD